MQKLTLKSFIQITFLSFPFNGNEGKNEILLKPSGWISGILASVTTCSREQLENIFLT
jgi:hypothetical protein